MKIQVRIDDHLYDVEVGDLNNRPVLVTLEGESFEVWPEEAESAHPALSAQQTTSFVSPVPVPVVSMAMASGQADKIKMVTAPIPGVILSVGVKAGDSIAFGQELCVLEAMKMKNQIRANRTGTISAVRVAPGDQVRHSQVLMEYAD